MTLKRVLEALAGESLTHVAQRFSVHNLGLLPNPVFVPWVTR